MMSQYTSYLNLARQHNILAFTALQEEAFRLVRNSMNGLACSCFCKPILGQDWDSAEQNRKPALRKSDNGRLLRRLSFYGFKEMRGETK